jgi:hypothetical protein
MRFENLHLAALSTALVAATLAAPAAPATADDHLIFHVYVSGPNAATIEIDDGSWDGAPVPAGTCGIRVHDPEYWYWSSGDAAETGELDVLHNGDPTNLIEISGAFEGCEQTPYSAITPATPSSWPPDDALSLVIEGWSGDVEYLDYNNDPLPVSDPPDGIDEPGDICEAVPEFCEDPLPIAVESFCQRFPELCYPFVQSSLGFVRAVDLGGSGNYQLATARHLLTIPGKRPAALKALVLAQKRVATAAEAVAQLRRDDDAIARALGTSSRPSTPHVFADRASGRIETANQWFARCARDLENARRRLAAGATPNLTPATTTCTEATTLIEAGRRTTAALTNWVMGSR